GYSGHVIAVIAGQIDRIDRIDQIDQIGQIATSYKPGFSSLTRDTFILATSFSPPSSSPFALQITLFGPSLPTLFSKQTHLSLQNFLFRL
ncbi:hypothetical protein L249_5512, partial [Ophiocordyceps polyrhachis-furcata BCC 54312]